MKKNTIVTTFRGDIKELATIALYLKNHGESLASLSQVIRTGLSCFHEMVISADPSTEIITLDEAIKTLEQLNIFDLAGKYRNKKTLIDGLALESLSQDQNGLVLTKPDNPFGTDLARKKLEEVLDENLKK